MRALGIIAFLAAAAAAATLTPFTPTLPIAFEQNLGQLNHPATHLAVDHGWAFSCGALYRRPTSWNGPQSAASIALNNANPGCQPSFGLPVPAVAHYYRGSDRSAWVESVPRFESLAFKNVAPGLDWVYQARAGLIEWRWNLSAATDPAAFTLRFDNSPF
ncbi:MAG: hypothetical protein HXY18_17680, partial [Bryobacteraceae bacterium]|nr:hypothetical protein [Bryobacteraceae bacterium]